MVVAIISATLAAQLQNTEYQLGIYYNPVQLQDSRWFISLVEAQYLTASKIIALEDYVPVEI